MTEAGLAAAQAIDDARIQRMPLAQDALHGLSGVAQAYEVQKHGIALRAARGEQVCGIKMGFTSRAKMVQMGVSEMIVGQLTDAMRVDDGGSVQRNRFIHPRIEPEIAFRLSRDLVAGATPDELARSVDAVAPAMEIIDSRYRDFRFDLSAVVADNTSAAAFAIGTWRRLRGSIDNLGLAMRINAGATISGTTAAILGNPWRSLAAAAALATQYGLLIPAGAIVLAGAATAAETLPNVGLVELEMAGLGRVQVRIGH